MDFQYILRSILALIIIIWLANILLKKLDNYMQGRSHSMIIVERFTISKSSSIAVVKIIDRYYLMSLTDSKNEILKEFEDEEIEELIHQIEENNDKNLSAKVQNFDYSKLKEKYRHYFEDDKK